MDVPSMVQRSGDTLIVRSVVSGDQIFLDQETRKVIKPIPGDRYDRFQPSVCLDGLPADMSDDLDGQVTIKDEGLPQCKIKRNYSCNSCTFFTQNPRYFLTHLRDVHGEKIVINECKQCLYASRHYQKLVRHMKMVHGSTEGIEEHGQARKRQMGREGRKRKIESSGPSASPVYPPIVPSPAKFDEISTEETPQNRLLKCSLCEFTTLYRAQLVEHEQDEHCKTKFFRCEKCTYVTHIKARFSKHVKYHSMPMIKCVTCDFRTPYKWNLDRHMKNHGGTGPFKCAACNFTADIKQSLTVHEMNHHVPPVGHAAGMSLARRKNKVGGTDIVEDFLSENGDLEDSINNNNNNVDDFDESLAKRYKYATEDQPTDLSQKQGHEAICQQKKNVRPVPNLIPIQAAGNALNLTKGFASLAQKELGAEKASLSDLASYFFRATTVPEVLGVDRVEAPQLSPSSNSSTASKKKGANFFDKLKETLAIDAARSENLVCGCGHTSKCLSESIIHRSACRKVESDEKRSSPSPINLSVNSGSTRCQYCRHRCKSSADLASHVRNCAEAGQCQNDSYDSFSDINERQEEDGVDEISGEAVVNKHPMENRIFVWNKLPDVKNEVGFGGDLEGENADTREGKNKALMQSGENGYYGVETAPGYGEMTPEEEAANSSLKKVYKCPHCAFWASTASRFHVHIVGHLNKKPFECSFCAYRSNWRWDITKHIRLKTIRDPNHKIARVLMNDETGRRNYTKYNKYITLMKVTEEDGDPKLLKSGEMTPHQEASLALLNEYNSSVHKTKTMEGHAEDGKPSETGSSQMSNLIGIDPNQFMRLPFFTPSVMGMMPPSQHEQQQQQQESVKRSPPLLMKPAEDLVTQNIDVRPDGSEKKTLYKCRKCNYRNPSRDMVLSHVKGHYQEAGINLTQKGGLSTPLQVAVNSNLYMNNVLAAMCLSQTLGTDKGGSQHHPLLTGSLAQPPVQTPSASLPQSIQSASNPTMLPLNLGMAAKPLEHGEVDERHCRLKHNSDIRIETVDRNSSKSSPVYHPLVTQPTSNGPSAFGGCSGVSLASKPTCSSTKPHPAASVKEQSGEQKFSSISTCKEATTKSEAAEVLDEAKQKQQVCPSCSFVSDSKSQMNYHVSLMHKSRGEVFECQSCGFTASKKQQLAQHKKAFHKDEQLEPEAIDLRAKGAVEDDLSDKGLFFCRECPARYVGIKDFSLHVKMHGVNLPFHCKWCSYRTRQEHDLRSHAIVHSAAYQEKTEKLCAKFKQSVDYPRPQLIQQVSTDLEESVWVVDRCGNNVSSDLEDSIQKNIIRVDEDREEATSVSLLKAQLQSSEKPKSPATNERCSDCPFETDNSEDYKAHILGHERISGRAESYRCFACDFSAPEDLLLKEHAKLHIQPITNCKRADYYASLKHLELNLVNSSDSDTATPTTESLFKSDSEMASDNGACSPHHRVILDATTGEIISQCEPASPGSP